MCVEERMIFYRQPPGTRKKERKKQCGPTKRIRIQKEKGYYHSDEYITYICDYIIWKAIKYKKINYLSGVQRQREEGLMTGKHTSLTIHLQYYYQLFCNAS